MKDGELKKRIEMIVAVIPAKIESNRLPKKNLLTINGKSLIEHAVQYVRKSKKIKYVYVSTDSKEIAEHAKELGADVIMRGSNLGGETPLIDVYRHAWKVINNKNITHIVGIQPDNPDRKTDLDKAIDYAISKKIDNLFTVDGQGHHNGALSILSLNALTASPSVYASSIKDDCTNIHSNFDFLAASRNLSEYIDTINIGNHCIGQNKPTFIVAEAACNHMCKIDLAKEMIDKAVESGVDAIKFQTYKAEKLVTDKAVAFWGKERISQLEYYKRLDLFGMKEYAELFNYARNKGIIAFSSPFDNESADMLAELNMPVFKIASCEITNLSLLRHIAGMDKPIILSTGASNQEEIDRAIETIFEQGNQQLMLMACTLSYPTRNEDANFLRIRTLKERFPGMIIGISDHTEPDQHMVIPSVAVALGARIIEKHYTLNRSMTGSGHFFAAEPDDLKKMVFNIRLTESILGDGLLGIAESEVKAWKSARRSVVAVIPIQKGVKITSEMVCLKRPAGGLPADKVDKVIGKIAKVDIKSNQYLSMDIIE